MVCRHITTTCIQHVTVRLDITTGWSSTLPRGRCVSRWTNNDLTECHRYVRRPDSKVSTVREHKVKTWWLSRNCKEAKTQEEWCSLSILCFTGSTAVLWLSWTYVLPSIIVLHSGLTPRSLGPCRIFIRLENMMFLRRDLSAHEADDIEASTKCASSPLIGVRVLDFTV